MIKDKGMKFELRIFDGKNVKFKDYKTLRGIEKRVGGKMNITSSTNVCYEGNDTNGDKITVRVLNYR